MRKVLILSNKVPYPAKDGSSIAMARLLENLIETGDSSITYGSINTVKHRKKIEDFPNNVLSEISLRTFDANTSPTIINGIGNLLLSKRPFHTVRFYLPKVLQWLDSFENKSFNTVILEGAFMGDYLTEAQRIGEKVVLRAHNLEHIIWERTTKNEGSIVKKWYLNLQSQRLKRFEESLAIKVDAIWSISPVDSDWFSALNTKTTFVPVSIAARPLSSEIKEKKCFFLGALDWLPNLESVEWFLRDVWPLIHSTDPSIEFHLAGNKIPSHLMNLKLSGLIVHRRVMNAEEFAKNHGISVIPLLSGSGVRIKLLENGSYGIPTVSTSIGAEGIYSASNTIIPIADDAESFARHIVRLCTDTSQASLLAQALHEDIRRRFSSENSIQAIHSAWPN
ncbi:MAG TPA: hypothetical protein DIT65_00070 [Cryomorphaceae bacterium]|nr:hypothetical protein [Cryomorphaceae bacterium]|tara:strand:+ start:2541 stop:3719 length:1179 start_codon:yes stop_codon:yes gene_type:complete